MSNGALKIGILTGSGTYALPGIEADGEPELVETRYGSAPVTSGRFGGVDVLHVSRHRPGHELLSSMVTHQANIAALKERGADAILSVTVCGALDANLSLGSLVVFDDLHFLANRLPDGSICTLFTEPGEKGRGHWIYERPFSQHLREALLAGAEEAGNYVGRRRLLRPRRRPALQHEDRDPDAAELRRHRRQPDRRARRPCSPARPRSRTRCSATRPTTPTA